MKFYNVYYLISKGKFSKRKYVLTKAGSEAEAVTKADKFCQKHIKAGYNITILSAEISQCFAAL